MTPSPPPGVFVCPACGSTNEANMRTTLSVPVVPPDHAWDPVFELRHCADCGATTPAHLAERWGNLDVAEAERQWRSSFQASSPFKPFYWQSVDSPPS